MVAAQREKEEEEVGKVSPDGPCMAALHQTRERVKAIVNSSAFDQLVLAAIGLNTLCLAVVHYNQPVAMTDVLEYLEYGFTTLFVMEAIFKLYGLGFVDYFSDSSNIFDFVITLLSLVSLFDFGAGNISALRTLRVFRALRIARILRRFPVIMRSFALYSLILM